MTPAERLGPRSSSHTDSSQSLAERLSPRSLSHTDSSQSFEADVADAPPASQAASTSESDHKKGDQDFTNANRKLTNRSVIAPYSMFTNSDRLLLIILLSLIGFWSSISSPIYFPALPTLSEKFKVSEELMNVSVVVYLICQGVAPTISSNVADSFGKRPVYLVAFLIFIGACIGLSQTNVFWLLAVLRCVQAAGIAPVIAINSGVGGDVCLPAERGGFLGVVNGMVLVGNGFGGLIGAAIISGFDWRAIFIFLAIGGGSTLLVVLAFLPETCRSIVGNGSVTPKRLINRSPLFLLPHYKSKLTNDTETLIPREKMDMLSPLRILCKVPVICTLLPAGLQFAAWTMTLTSISTVLESSSYNYSVMHVGLIYLPQGIACFIASLLSGKLMNLYYVYRSGLHEKRYQDYDLADRPPLNRYRIRLDIAVIPAALMLIGLVIFGWCLEFKQPIISIIVATCLISFSASSFMAIVTTLLVDIHPTKGSTATSCVNLVRCLLAAVGVAVLEKMSAKMTLGGTYTFLAGLCLLSYIPLGLVVWHRTKKLYKDYQRKEDPSDDKI